MAFLRSLRRRWVLTPILLLVLLLLLVLIQDKLPRHSKRTAQQPTALRATFNTSACIIHVPISHLWVRTDPSVLSSLLAAFGKLPEACYMHVYVKSQHVNLVKEQVKQTNVAVLPDLLLTDWLERYILHPAIIPEEPIEHAHNTYRQLHAAVPVILTTHSILLLNESCQLHPKALILARDLYQQLTTSSSSSTLLGVALQSSTFDLDTLGYEPSLMMLQDNRSLYTLQQPASGGMMLQLPLVINFLSWFQARQQVLALGRLSALSALQHSRAWRDYMTEFQRTLLYLPLQGGGLVECPLGTQSFVTSAQVAELQTWTPALTMDVLPVYNAAKRYLHTDANTLYARDAAMFGQCTLVITVYKRHEHIADFIGFYHHAVVLSAIVVVWNAIDQPLPALDLKAYRVPIILEQETVNSINNRFKPRASLKTDCIINMDDDWRMPHQVLFFSSRVWHYRHSHQLVGLSYLARTHGHDSEHSSWRYLKNRSVPQSLVLPSGLVYHRDLLTLYTDPALASARALVDTKMNCDDLLLNLVAANSTGLPPVYINTGRVRRAKVIKELGKDAGLWRRQQHYTDRHACLNAFATVFGGLPLAYTAWAYDIDDHLGRAPSGRGLLKVEHVTCQQVHGQCRDDCVVCHEG